ncbi:hypothetical protein F5883DRAFT_590172 [Diaporthe sp. PMI_573]|nr:hypothetical protein F5883DRAFT_590172 [Diaporthaceae sp. PMI_573]
MRKTPRPKRQRTETGRGAESRARTRASRITESATPLGPAATSDGQRDDGDGDIASRSRRDGSNHHTIYVSPQPQPLPDHSSQTRSSSMEVSPAVSLCNSPAPVARGAFTQNRYAPAGADNGGKRHTRSSPTLVDLTNEEVGQEDAGLSTTPHLPFRPQDLARFTSKPGVEQWLNDEIINTFFEYFVALNENLRTASSGIWVVRQSGRRKMACTPSTIFLLPTNLDSKHWVCLVIDVGLLAYEMFDPLPGQDYNKTCSQLAAGFIGEWLPEPFNDWDKWHIKQPRHSPQQPNLYDCGPFIIAFGLYYALWKEVPTSFDHQFLRSFIHTLGVNINYAAATSTFVSPDNNENQPTTSELNTSLQFLNALPTQCVPEYQDQVPGLPLGTLNTAIAVLHDSTLDHVAACEQVLSDYIAQSRDAANSYIDAQIIELECLRVTADQFVMLAEALCTAGQTMVERMETLEREETALESIKRASTSLMIVNKQREIMKIVDESLPVIRREKARADRLILFKRAVEEAQVLTVAKHLEETRDKYLRHHTVHKHCSIMSMGVASS